MLHTTPITSMSSAGGIVEVGVSYVVLQHAYLHGKTSMCASMRGLVLCGPSTCCFQALQGTTLAPTTAVLHARRWIHIWIAMQLAKSRAEGTPCASSTKGLRVRTYTCTLRFGASVEPRKVLAVSSEIAHSLSG